MKRIRLTTEEMDRLLFNTRRPAELTATEAFVRIGDVEYHAPLAAIATAALDGVA